MIFLILFQFISLFIYTEFIRSMNMFWIYLKICTLPDCRTLPHHWTAAHCCAHCRTTAAHCRPHCRTLPHCRSTVCIRLHVWGCMYVTVCMRLYVVRLYVCIETVCIMRLHAYMYETVCIQSRMRLHVRDYVLYAYSSLIWDCMYEAVYMYHATVCMRLYVWDYCMYYETVCTHETVCMRLYLWDCMYATTTVCS